MGTVYGIGILLPQVIGGLCSFAAWLLTGCFGVWAYRKLRFPTGPYLGVYWLLSLPMLNQLNGFILRQLLPASLMQALPSYRGFIYWMNVPGGIATFLATLLVLSELGAFLQKAGIQIDSRLVRVLLPWREFAFSLGLVAVGMKTFQQLIWLLLTIGYY